jgi:hypothetical protein
MRLIAQAAAPTQRKDPKDNGSGKRGRGRGRDKKGGRGDKGRDGRRKGSGVAGEGSESEEGFGDDGADWEVYRAMDMRDSDSGTRIHSSMRSRLHEVLLFSGKRP